MATALTCCALGSRSQAAAAAKRAEEERAAAALVRLEICRLESGYQARSEMPLWGLAALFRRL